MRFLDVMKSRKGKPLNLELVRGRIAELCHQKGIELFYLFGSYAKEASNNLSDVDVAYLAKEKIEELDLIPELQEIFEDEAIDLVDLKHAPPSLTHRILKEGKCLHVSDSRTKLDFETRVETIYWDTAWMRKEYFEKMLERIENGTFGFR